MHLFLKDLQRNLQDAIKMPNTAKKNLNVRFILENTGHACCRLTVIPDIGRWLFVFMFLVCLFSL